jgi:ketosteroid isomerase-like protein
MAFGLLLSACGEEPASPPPEPRRASQTPPLPPAPGAAPAAEQPPAAAGAEDAAEVVRTYYSLIGARRYGEAHALREPAEGAPGGEAFAAAFEPYAEYRATIGTPSKPVESGGWLYVEVPVQPYGRMKDGRPLASAGTLTLRRRKQGGQWRIFTKG